MHLLVTKINNLGDAVSFLPTLDGLCRALPEAAITLLCSRNTEAIFRRNFPGITVSAFEFAETRGRNAIVGVIKEWRRRWGATFDMSLHSYDEPSFSYALAFLLRVPERVGFAGATARASRLLTKRLPFPPGRNVVDLHFDLVRQIADANVQPLRVPLAVNAEEQAKVGALLAGLGWRPDRPLVVIHPYAKRQYQEWGIENFHDVSRQIETATRALVVFVGERDMPEHPGLAWIAGLTIHELAGLFQRSALFIGNNSGPMHVAAAMGTPTLTVQGPSPAEWSVFWTDRPHERVVTRTLTCVPCESLRQVIGHCTNAAYPRGCMREIKPETVIDRAIAQLAR